MAATAEFHKQVDLMESVVRLLLKKIDTMNAGNVCVAGLVSVGTFAHVSCACFLVLVS